MNEDRTKPGVPFWATVVSVATPVLYMFGIGPACWLSSRMNAGAPAVVSTVYRPVTWVMSQSDQIASAIDWYSEFGSADGWGWTRSTWSQYQDEWETAAPIWGPGPDSKLNVNRGEYHDEWAQTPTVE